MFDPLRHLLSYHLMVCLAELQADPARSDPWTRAAEALGGTRAKEPDLAAAIDARDVQALHGIAEQWSARKRPLPEHDREVMKRAMKAFRKTLKLSQLDSESRIGGSPMSSGKSSSIVGISPPSQYPREVWDTLVRQGELRGRDGVYELPPGAARD
jgi:hypothetical protein